MTDKVEIQGKTVDEAVAEALLRMGARRDEVDVTVLEEPKNGFFGFLGGRPARVIVRRRAGGRRPRSNDFRMESADHRAHDLGKGSGGRGGQGRSGGRDGGRDESAEGGREGRGGRGSRGGRGRGRGGRDGARPEGQEPARADGRSEGRSENSNDNRGEGRGRGGRGDNRPEQARQARPERGERPPRDDRQNGSDRERVQAAGGDRSRDGDQDEKRSGGRRRGRRGGRGRSGGGRDQRPAPMGDTMEHLEHDQRRSIAEEQAEFARIQAQKAAGEAGLPADEVRVDGADGARAERGEGTERGEGRSRGRRGGRSRGGRGSRRDEGRDDRRPAAETANGGDEPILPASEPANERVAPAAASLGGDHVAAEAAPAPRRAPVAAAGVEETIAMGIKASRYATAKRGLEEAGIDAGLTELAGGMLVRAGFPCRCEVKPGEYRLVKVITDDISAGMLIGRHGQAIDAVEHLVERMASAAAGDRVRMNLDINNYRRRREDSLLDYVAQMVARVKTSGEDVHLEPMEARDRRIVHLEAELTKGLRTWTLGGPGGKHVVIGLDDGRARGEEYDPVEVDGDDEQGCADEQSCADEGTTEAVETATPAPDEEQERPGADA